MPTTPIAGFVASPRSGVWPLVCEFTDTSTGDITSWFWEFGDGKVSAVPTPQHTFTAAGSYDVGLTVTGPGGSDHILLADYISVSTPAPSLLNVAVGIGWRRRPLRHISARQRISIRPSLRAGLLAPNQQANALSEIAAERIQITGVRTNKTFIPTAAPIQLHSTTALAIATPRASTAQAANVYRQASALVDPVSAVYREANPTQAPNGIEWIGYITQFDATRQPHPPSPYVPPNPLIVVPPWIGMAVRPLPLIQFFGGTTRFCSGRIFNTVSRFRWREARSPSVELRMPWGESYGYAESLYGIDIRWPDSWSRTIIPRRKFYMILHDLWVVRLPDRTPIPCSGLTLYLDSTTWAWSASLQLIGRDTIQLVTPTGSDPVQLEIGINGATWVIVVESWTRTGSFGQDDIKLVGRGLSALLSDRYVRPRDYEELYALTMAQLANQELPYGGGWDLIWTAADWPVPAGVWTYKNLSPIQAIARLAAASGGMVVPSRNSLALTVAPAYRLAPWVWTDGQEDVLIPLSAIRNLSFQYRYPDQANAVYVYGGEGGGIQARVYRSGSAGDEYTDDRHEPLITHSDGAMAIGTRILSANSSPPAVSSISTWVDPGGDFPVIELGDLVRIDTVDGSMGPVSSLEISASVSAQRTSVIQSLRIGETRNDYQRLLALIPRETRFLGRVTGTYTDGTVSVATLSGGLLRIRGSAAIDSWVWVLNDRIDSIAPSMQAYNIDV